MKVSITRLENTSRRLLKETLLIGVLPKGKTREGWSSDEFIKHERSLLITYMLSEKIFQIKASGFLWELNVAKFFLFAYEYKWLTNDVQMSYNIFISQA